MSKKYTVEHQLGSSEFIINKNRMSDGLNRQETVCVCDFQANAELVCRLLNEEKDMREIAGYADCLLFTHQIHGFNNCSKADEKTFIEVNGSFEWCEVCRLKNKLKMFPFNEEAIEQLEESE